MAKLKSKLKSPTMVTVTRKRGGGATGVVVKLNGVVLSFNDNKDEDTISISADSPGTYKVIVAVRTNRDSTGEALFKLGDTTLLDLSCKIANDEGIDHSDGTFKL